MLLTKKRIIAAGLTVLFTAGISLSFAKGSYIPTARDTKLPPESVTYDLTVMDEYEFLYESDTLAYYFREDRDVIAIVDKRNGYTWKTGLDIPFPADLEQAVMQAETPEEAEELGTTPAEARMNSIYTGISNSLITVEYIENSVVKSISSASREDASSKLMTIDNDPAKRRLDVEFPALRLSVKVYVTFGEDFITYEILDEDITGEGKAILAGINITPFMGASGGKQRLFDEEWNSYNTDPLTFVDKYMVPGYVLIPDGSGSLIRFQDNSAVFTDYVGNVYGIDPASYQSSSTMLSDVVPMKEPSMPVFGIAHGNQQAAFVAYAEDGDEHMQLVVRPEESNTYYTWAYPRFVYNNEFFQRYNNKGEGANAVIEEPFQLHVKISYAFLSGDGSDGGYAADYVGMAGKYRQHLLDTGQIILKEGTQEAIPLRLDFIMSESKKSIVGTDEVVMTTVSDVEEILIDMQDNYGIRNLNAGMTGWQKKGATLAKPNKTAVSGNVGSKKAFKRLITDMAERGIDLSYARDYASIHESMMDNAGNAVRHVDTLYASLDKSFIIPPTALEYMYAYALPKKSASWLRTQHDYQKDHVSSMTISGITTLLTSNYTRDGVETTRKETISLYQDVLSELNSGLLLNLENPNKYLWQYTDRFLQCPVGGSQYLFETDAVPFLQMVLHGTMELYAPYSNFSFYTQKDVLKMIDYNLFPSFILSKQPSYLLADTAMSHLYSTEYQHYAEMISSIYHKVDAVLSKISGYDWVSRAVLENGVIMNTYRKGQEQKYVVVNYTDETYSFNGTSVDALRASVIEGGAVQ